MAPGFPLTSQPAQGEAGPSGLLPLEERGKCTPRRLSSPCCPRWPLRLHSHAGACAATVEGRPSWGASPWRRLALQATRPAWPSGGTALSCLCAQATICLPAQCSFHDSNSLLCSRNLQFQLRGLECSWAGTCHRPRRATWHGWPSQSCVAGRGQESPGLLLQAHGDSLSQRTCSCPEERDQACPRLDASQPGVLSTCCCLHIQPLLLSRVPACLRRGGS